MRRREFILSVGSFASVFTSVSYGQQQLSKRPVVGFLVAGTQASHGAWVVAFAQHLSELGWIEGRNLKIEYRWAAGDTQQMAEFAAEFAQQKVDVIVTSAYGAVAAKKATYPAVIGLDKSRAEAQRLTSKAHAALEPLGSKAEQLRAIASYLLRREY